jgi:hypothetical protein
MSTPTPTPESGNTSKIDFGDMKQLDKLIEGLIACNPLPEDTVNQLCAHAKDILVKELNV